MGLYRVAQICLNGHIITGSADAYPTDQEKFCSTCGLKTIMQCPDCDANIRGDYYNPDHTYLYNTYSKPLYCNNCGNPYPWTKDALDRARKLISYDEDLSDDDKVTLSNDIENIVRDSPKTKLSAVRFKNFLSNASLNTVVALRDILVEVVSEAAKKIIWPE